MVLLECESGRYLSWFPQFPNITANGDTKQEASDNLLEMVRTVFEHNNNELPEFRRTLKTFNLTISEA